MTANDLIEAAVLKLGAKATGETLTASELSDSLSVLNSILDAWSIDRLLVYQIVQTNYTWAALATSRTIGVGGDLSGVRPIRIEEGTFFRNATENVDHQVNIIRDRSVYDSISVKDTTTNYPNYLFYDTAYPLGVLKAYPTPATSLTLSLNYWLPLQSFASGTTVVSLPPGYQWAIENNLAVALEAVFVMPAPASVQRAALTSLASIRRINHVPITSGTDVVHILASSSTNGYGRSNIKAGD